jgi:serine/threonine-protein kinase
MEPVDGPDADGLLRSPDPLTADQTIRIVTQVCDALAYAHEHGIVHGDVSPANTMLSRSDGAVRLGDFGLVSSPGNATYAPKPRPIGTPGYVVPEIPWRARPTVRSDLYSLGVLAYRFLTVSHEGPPGGWGRHTPLATAVPRLPRLADARPDLPPPLVAAVQQAIDPDADNRQSSVAESRAQLLDGLGAPLPLAA